MSVTRANAVVNEQLALTIEFLNSGNYYDPESVNNVKIKNADGDILETIPSSAITHVSTGIYSIVTSAAWNTEAQTVRDVWNYTPTSGADPVEIVQNVAIIAPDTLEAELTYLDVCTLRKTPVGLDFSKYSDEELYSMLLVAKDVIDGYCARQFGQGRFQEEGEAIVDYTGRILISTQNKPIKKIHKVEVWVSGLNRIELDLTYADIFYKAGYLYFTTSHTPFSNPNSGYPDIVLGMSHTVFYEIDYSVSENITPSIKQACAFIVANLLKSHALFSKTGAVGVETGIAEFQSDDYRVRFGDPGKYSEELSKTILTPTVCQLLNRNRRAGQNTA